jgi:hypothetical protein
LHRRALAVLRKKLDLGGIDLAVRGQTGPHDERVVALTKVVFLLLTDALRLVIRSLRSSRSLSAENLFLRRQLARTANRSDDARHPGWFVGWLSSAINCID